MKNVSTMLLGLAMTVSTAQAADTPDPAREQAFQDHIAYVATFAMPVLIEKCSATDPTYLQRAAPAYFRYVNAHQDRIERGRLLTLAEFAPGDEVIVPDLTFAATINTVIHAGATPVIVDVDRRSWNIDPAKVEAMIALMQAALGR